MRIAKIKIRVDSQWRWLSWRERSFEDRLLGIKTLFDRLQVANAAISDLLSAAVCIYKPPQMNVSRRTVDSIWKTHAMTLSPLIRYR